MQLTFLGATETVTGSKYLLSFGDNQNILVDCGLFQGYKELRLRNWNPLPFDPKILNAVLLIHAHIEAITNTSAHADYEEILEWLKRFSTPPKKTFITHGEPEAALSLKNKIESELGWNCVVPHFQQTEQLI